jgi:uncharacterized membrane protein YgdD (TMEM256/DUF423 family)
MLQCPRMRRLSVDGLMRAADDANHTPDNVSGAAHGRGVRWLALAGAVLALTGVAAGAFGTHALKAWLPAQRMAAFETAARYQLTHALALLACAWVLQSWPSRAALGAGGCFVIGAVFFCGSLYGLALTGNPVLGVATALGGVGFLAGWTLLIVAIVKSKKSTSALR